MKRLWSFVLMVVLLSLAGCWQEETPVESMAATEPPVMQETETEAQDTTAPELPVMQETETEVQDTTAPEPVEELEQEITQSKVPYTVQVKRLNLPVYHQPTYDAMAVDVVNEQGVYTVVEEQTDSEGILWGRLKSGIGWIDLEAAQVQVPVAVSHNVKSLLDSYPVVASYDIDGTLTVLLFVDEKVTDFSVVQVEHFWDDRTPYISRVYGSLEELAPNQGVQITMAFYGDVQESDVGVCFTDSDGNKRCFYITDNGRNNALHLVEVFM